TVVFGNQPPASQITTTCMDKNSAYVGAAGPNDVALNPTTCMASVLFADPANDDFHLKKGGPVDCTLVDRGTNMNAPDHDLDGFARAQGSTVDIGCYEAR